MRRKRMLDDRSACRSDAELSRLTALGGIPRPVNWYDGCPVPGRVVVTDILCWWCRSRHSPGEVEKCMALERPVIAEPGGSISSLTARIPPWLAQFPELWEFLSKPSYKDGTPRQMGKISLSLVSDGIQVTLTDPSTSAYCCRQYKSLDDALLTLEVGLGEGSLTWKASNPPKGRKGR